MYSPEKRGSMHEARRAAQSYYQMFDARGISFFSNLFGNQTIKEIEDIEELYEKAGSGTSKTKLGMYQKILLFLGMMATI